MLTPMTGRSVIVTGASKGIGKGIARVFARHGARVLVVARSAEGAESAAAEIGDAARACAADVSTWEGCERVAAAAAEAFGGVDVLCANAGIFPASKIEDMDPDEWDAVLGTNLRASFLGVKACLPYLKRSNQGRVVLTSSITGAMTGFPGWSHYGASKAGQIGFLRTACIELSKFGITINAVLPGNVYTEGLEGMGEEYLKTMTASIPLGKLGEVDDIGYAALFLASKEAGYITGQTLVVDGGQTQPETLEALDA